MGSGISADPRTPDGAESAQEGATAAAEAGIGYDRLFGAFYWLPFLMNERECLCEAVRKPEGVEMHQGVAGTGGTMPEKEPEKIGSRSGTGIQNGDGTAAR